MFDKNNFQLIEELLCKEWDESYQFRKELAISKRNIQQTFCLFEHEDFPVLSKFIKRDDELINYKKDQVIDRQLEWRKENKLTNFENLNLNLLKRKEIQNKVLSPQVKPRSQTNSPQASPLSNKIASPVLRKQIPLKIKEELEEEINPIQLEAIVSN